MCALAAAAVAAIAGVPASSASPGAPVPVTIDTDIFSSVDDVGALAIGFALQQQNEAKVIAIGVSTRLDRPAVAPDSWKCAAAVAQFYNSGNVPIGTDQPANGTEVNTPNFVTPCGQLASPSTPVPDSAVNVYRRALVGQPDGSVVMIGTGYLENLSALLDSPADSISPLTGSQLIAQKVKELDVMAGGYPSRPHENNLAGNPAAAQDVAANWPTKVVWDGYEVGDAVHTGQTLSSTAPANSPVRVAYEAFVQPNNWYFSYDLTAVYHAIRPSDPLMTEVGPGTNAVDSNGGNVFTPGSGNQVYLQLNDANGLDAALEQLLDVVPGPADITPPAISGTGAGSITTTGATVSWSTDELADTQVEYGTTTSYGSSTTLDSALGTSHSQALTGLTPGVTYHYRVKSRDAAGNLATSGDLTFTTTALVSTTVAATPATVAGGGSITVSWSGIASPTINDWIGLYKPGAADTAFLSWFFTPTCTNSTGTPKASGSCSVTMPVTAGIYEFRLFANNGYTKLATSGQVTVNAADTTAPSISAVNAGGPTTTGAAITWTTDEASDSQVEYGTTTSYGASTTLDSTAVTSHSQSLAGLTPNTLYHYRVKSRDAAGNLGTSADFTFTTAAAGPVISGVTAGSITSSGATITWTTNVASDSQVEWGFTTAYGTSTALNTTRVTSHSQAIAGIAAGMLYHYRVKSRDAGGNLAVSGDFTFTTSGGSAQGVTPGTPSATPVTGTGPVTVTWAAPAGLNPATTKYTVQHADANDTAYTTVTSGLSAKTYSFTEQAGTWTYKVIAIDGSLTTGPSSASNTVVVDKSGPKAPSFSSNRPPEYTGNGNWWKGSVTISVVQNGDALLPDGSPGSGINPQGTTAPYTVTGSGPHTVDGWVEDNVGNWTKASMVVQVDATPPGLWWNTKCGQTFRRGSTAWANWGVSDANVGIAGPASGNIAYDTSTVGNKTLSVTKADLVGNTTTITCSYKVN